MMDGPQVGLRDVHAYAIMPDRMVPQGEGGRTLEETHANGKRATLSGRRQDS